MPNPFQWLEDLNKKIGEVPSVSSATGISDALKTDLPIEKPNPLLVGKILLNAATNNPDQISRDLMKEWKTTEKKQEKDTKAKIKSDKANIKKNEKIIKKAQAAKVKADKKAKTAKAKVKKAVAKKASALNTAQAKVAKAAEKAAKAEQKAAVDKSKKAAEAVKKAAEAKKKAESKAADQAVKLLQVANPLFQSESAVANQKQIAEIIGANNLITAKTNPSDYAYAVTYEQNQALNAELGVDMSKWTGEY